MVFLTPRHRAGDTNHPVRQVGESPESERPSGTAPRLLGPDTLRLCVRVPARTRVEAQGWSQGQWGGIEHWYARVLPGAMAPPFAAELGTEDLEVSLAVDSHARRRTMPWLWFFRDYCGVIPHVLEPESPTESRNGNVLLTDSFHADAVASLVVVQAEGDTRAHTFRVRDKHPVTYPLAPGSTIPFWGVVRALDNNHLRPLLVDADGATVMGCVSGPRPRVVLGFDPITALWEDAQRDTSASAAGINANWVYVLLRSFIWSSPLSLWKGLWPNDVPPLIYSVDVEAAVTYFDRDKRVCVWSAGRPRARHRQDTKLEESLRTSVRRLRTHAIIGTFHLDLNSVTDEADVRALRDDTDEHDIAFHAPAIGTHQDWKVLVEDPRETLVALRDGKKALESWVQRPVRGFRYPAWHRLSSTHDLVAEVGLGYDSSTFAHSPFLTIPYRLVHSAAERPLALWEFPCVAIDGAVNAGPLRLRGLRTRMRNIRRAVAFLESCADNQTMVVICDHDMALGAAVGHRHGTWRLNDRGLRTILRTVEREAAAQRLRPTRGSDFLAWWEASRKASFRVVPESHEGLGLSKVGVVWQEAV